MGEGPLAGKALAALAVSLSVLALFVYERAWIRAGQEVPLS